MSYLDDEPGPDPDRRGFIFGALACVPAIGGGFELAAKILARPARSEAAKAGARMLLEAEPERFPYSKAGEAAADRYQRTDDR